MQTTAHPCLAQKCAAPAPATPADPASTKGSTFVEVTAPAPPPIIEVPEGTFAILSVLDGIVAYSFQAKGSSVILWSSAPVAKFADVRNLIPKQPEVAGLPEPSQPPRKRNKPMRTAAKKPKVTPITAAGPIEVNPFQEFIQQQFPYASPDACSLAEHDVSTNTEPPIYLGDQAPDYNQLLARLIATSWRNHLAAAENQIHGNLWSHLAASKAAKIAAAVATIAVGSVAVFFGIRHRRRAQ